MAAITRWVQYPIDEEGVAGTGGGTATGLGTQAVSVADGASDTDSFSISSSSNRLYLSIDGDSAPYITLASGTDLDPRFVARDITEKLHNLGKSDPSYDQAKCVWENGKLRIYSGSLGSGTSVSVVSGTNTAHLELGWGTESATGGSDDSNSYNGGLTVSGTYGGLFDEVYTIIINNEYNINTPVKGGSNSYTGTITEGGIFNNASSITYTINISTTNGTTMGGGTGNVPEMTWTSTGSADDSAAAVELLYPNYWYKVGTKGLMVKFTDAVFSHCPPGTPAWTITCDYPQYAQGTNTSADDGVAQYTWGSDRGDDGSGPSDIITTSESAFTRLGSRGLYIKFSGNNNFTAGDEFRVICTGPQPQSYDITNLNYGNVTVSTESAVKAVMFEIMSGAVEMSTVKFGLQSHGSFSHHQENNADTYFRFGTVGPGQSAGTSPQDGIEWRANVTAGDIDNDTPPSYLYSTEDDLSVVADADASEAIGSSSYAGMTSDAIYLGVKLGASEVGANSTINYRVYFDYS
jgi:hypothetical protein